jgi:hypothetical protein
MSCNFSLLWFDDDSVAAITAVLLQNKCSFFYVNTLIQGISLTYLLRVTTLDYSNRVFPTMVCSFSANYPVKLKTLSL